MRVVTLAIAIVIIAAPATARAEPLRVTAGGVHLDFEGHWFDLRGAGFAITNAGSFEFLPVEFGSLCFPCRGGDAIDLTFRTVGGLQPLGWGPATFDGTSYSQLFYSVDFTTRGTPQTFPVTDAFAVHFRQPFVFTGTVRAFTDPERSALAFAAVFGGRGIARTSFFRDEDSGAHLIEEGQIAYVFDDAHPVPEPSTVLLVGAGLTLGIRRLRRSRTRPS